MVIKQLPVGRTFTQRLQGAACMYIFYSSVFALAMPAGEIPENRKISGVLKKNYEHSASMKNPVRASGSEFTAARESFFRGENLLNTIEKKSRSETDKEGAFLGIRFLEVRRGSFLSFFGVQSGDLLLAIDQIRVLDPAEAKYYGTDRALSVLPFPPPNFSGECEFFLKRKNSFIRIITQVRPPRVATGNR